MMDDKMIAAITKVFGKEVEIKNVEQDGKNLIAETVADGDVFKVTLSERKNQYSVYCRVNLCQYFGQKKWKDYATFFSSSSSFC